jgi:hypothetical protein
MPILMNNNQLKRLNLNKSEALTFYPPKGLFKIDNVRLMLHYGVRLE